MDISDFKIQDILTELMKIAKADGLITDEEKDFLISFNRDVSKYQKTIDQAFDDKVLNDAEYKELIEVKNSILKDIKDYKNDHDNIDSDVKLLFNRLSELINQHEIPRTG